MRLSNKGFTLIELMVGVALWMLIALAVGNLFQTSLKVRKQIENITPLQHEARTVLNRIAREFRNAIDVPGIGWTVSPDGISFGTLRDGRVMKVTYPDAHLQPGVLKSVQQELSPKNSIPARETMITHHPASMTWEYAYRTSPTRLEWRKEWKPQGDEPMPRAIRVQLILFDEKNDPHAYTRTILSPVSRTIPWVR